MSGGCLKLSKKNKLHRLNTERSLSPFFFYFRKNYVEVESSRTADDICFAYWIYYLIIHHVFRRQNGTLTGGEGPNFEKRALASVRRQPNYLQSVYMMQNLQLFIDFRTIQNAEEPNCTRATRPAASCVWLVLTY